jgi:hypothetical protein
MCCVVVTQLVTVKLAVRTANEARSELLLYISSDSNMTLANRSTKAVENAVAKPFDWMQSFAYLYSSGVLLAQLVKVFIALLNLHQYTHTTEGNAGTQSHCCMRDDTLCTVTVCTGTSRCENACTQLSQRASLSVRTAGILTLNII